MASLYNRLRLGNTAIFTTKLYAPEEFSRRALPHPQMTRANLTGLTVLITRAHCRHVNNFPCVPAGSRIRVFRVLEHGSA